MRRRLAAIVFAAFAFVALTFLSSATATLLVAQSTPPPSPPGVSAAVDSLRAARGVRLSISLLTYGPGDEVFERFGHIALVVHDSTTGEDIAFNWGMFDFNQPNFLVNFLTGDTKYWMAGFNTLAFNDLYRRDNRRIRRQLRKRRCSSSLHGMRATKTSSIGTTTIATTVQLAFAMQSIVFCLARSSPRLLF